jgi:hypothetical protein
MESKQLDWRMGHIRGRVVSEGRGRVIVSGRCVDVDDDLGNFVMVNVEPGKRVIEVECEDYEPMRVELEVCVGDNPGLLFKLQQESVVFFDVVKKKREVMNCVS